MTSGLSGESIRSEETHWTVCGMLGDGRKYSAGLERTFGVKKLIGQSVGCKVMVGSIRYMGRP